MEDYRKFISPKRQSVPTPKSIVENGQAVFGTFDKEFEEMPLLDLVHPAGKLLPNCLNKIKLTLWEATEIHLDNGILLVALTDMGWFGMTITIFYDRIKKKVYSWKNILPAKKTVIAPNIINGSVSEAYTKNSSIKYVNDFGVGKANIKGYSTSKKDGKIEFDYELERVSLPSVVSIPFGKNRPLYSQKDIFKAKGYFIFNGERFDSTEESAALIDDHRGYYPRKMHYDWIMTVGKNEIDGEKKYIGLNLTRNQSINQEDYNENLLFLEGETSLLPPVKFIHNADSTVWTIIDEHDMVNITFNIYDRFSMLVHTGIVNIDYYYTFGEFKGYVRDLNGKKYILDGNMGAGEDKTMKF